MTSTGEGQLTEASPTSKLRGGRLLKSVGLVVAAVALGVFADVGSHGFGPWLAAPEWHFPWLLVAFLGGRLFPRPMLGAGLTGSGLLLTALAAYYVWLWWGQGVALSTIVVSYQIGTWMLLGAPLGFVMGLIGAATRSRATLMRELAWATVPGAMTLDLMRVVRWEELPAREWVMVALGGLILVTILYAARVSSLRLARYCALCALAAGVMWSGWFLVMRHVFRAACCV